PSGDQRGQVSPLGPLVRGRGSAPSRVSTSHIRSRSVGWSATHSLSTKATRVPSALICGSDGVRMPRAISKVGGVRGCAASTSLFFVTGDKPSQQCTKLLVYEESLAIRPFPPTASSMCSCVLSGGGAPR